MGFRQLKSCDVKLVEMTENRNGLEYFCAIWCLQYHRFSHTRFFLKWLQSELFIQLINGSAERVNWQCYEASVFSMYSF